MNDQGATLDERFDLVAGIAREHASEVDRLNRFPVEAVEAMRRYSLLSCAASRAVGGEDADLEIVSRGCSRIASACASSGLIYAMHVACLHNILCYGDDTPALRALRDAIVRDGLLCASATSEVGTGGDIGRSLCSIERQDEEITVSKSCSIISYGEQADVYFLTARRRSDAPESDQVLAVLDRAHCTRMRTRDWDAFGMRGTCSHAFDITATVPIGQVFKTPFSTILATSLKPASHILWASVWGGIADAAVDKARSARGGSTVVDALENRLRDYWARVRQSIHSFADGRAGDSLGMCLAFEAELNTLKIECSEQALKLVLDAFRTIGFQAYLNNTPCSLGVHLRDVLSSIVMVSNIRLLSLNREMELLSEHLKRREA